MKKRVEFWKKVYTQIDTYRGFIHDINEPWIIYENIDLHGLSKKRAERKIRNSIYQVRKVLNSIISKKKLRLTKQEKRYLDALGNPSIKLMRRKRSQIRFQRGMSDRFKTGHEKAHLYLKYIKKIFQKNALPQELVFLPHVESSFNIKAHSKSDAAGIWQFMRPVGKKLGLVINDYIDERLDPIKSSDAAAKLLKQNFKILNSWPLAITAYNCGPGLLRRGIKKTKSRDLNDLILNYRKTGWGFAAKNFYATFVAAADISLNWKNYISLSKWEAKEAIEFTRIQIPKNIRLNKLMGILGGHKKEFISLNPSLKQKAFRYNYKLPSNYYLNLPADLENKKESILNRL